ncbi:MAG: PQQ-dependent sugar dehydrogenase [Chloroflexi bacterium]|nr:PQQ-dependent sugar dehydrogenase [Chloroflexota bacterium]MBP7045101.1 PQQ-dependent sugar dehydrogenase [Chloroflexota bacterium]
MKQLLFLSFLVLFGLTACNPDRSPATAVLPTAESGMAVTSVSLFPVVVEGLDQPLYLTNAGDGRLFIVEKEGAIRIVQDGRLLDDPFLDIRDRVNADSSERGLLSIAFHPDYARNGRFFVNYTNLAGNTAVSAFQIGSSPNQADPNSESILLTIRQPYANHNGGQLQFGPDGYLYIGMGDGGSGGDPQGNGQNPASLLGALLRLDIDQATDAAQYGIPADNPFVADAAKLPEIWATGLRNPWRFSFDRATGDLLIADVGQNQWEEVNFLPAGSPGGSNFGWNIMEGTHCYDRNTCNQTGLVLPVIDYRHEQGRCSITGGYVYRGSQFPTLGGVYFFGDYCSGEIWGMTAGENGRFSAQVLYRSPSRIASFGEDAAGELYVVDISGGIYQIRE